MRGDPWCGRDGYSGGSACRSGLCSARSTIRRVGERAARRGNPGGERDARGGEVDQRLALGGSVAGCTRVRQRCRPGGQRWRAADLVQLERPPHANQPASRSAPSSPKAPQLGAARGTNKKARPLANSNTAKVAPNRRRKRRRSFRPGDPPPSRHAAMDPPRRPHPGPDRARSAAPRPARPRAGAPTAAPRPRASLPSTPARPSSATRRARRRGELGVPHAAPTIRRALRGWTAHVSHPDLQHTAPARLELQLDEPDELRGPASLPARARGLRQARAAGDPVADRQAPSWRSVAGPTADRRPETGLPERATRVSRAAAATVRPRGETARDQGPGSRPTATGSPPAATCAG